jgi:alpha-beta hydrolase superfamily lysophospholipase
MANRMADSCYNFYAVDLRRYGRSLMDNQLASDMRDDHEYFADIDSAIAVIRRDGITDVTLMGHSTGGLTTALYMTETPDPVVKRLILNSPFLDWRFSPKLERYGIPTVSFLGRLFKTIKIKQSGEGKYGHSLLKDYDGEWEYRTEWKQINTTIVTTGWVSAINRAQHTLRSRHITVPILLMHSDKSSSGKNARMFDTDIVLDVDDIHRYGTALGNDVTEASIPGGLHDLILSHKEARDSTYRAIFNFLQIKH